VDGAPLVAPPAGHGAIVNLPPTASPAILDRVSDPAGLLYGALVAASVLATASLHTEDFTRIGLSTVAVLVVYWMAHVYVAAQERQFTGDRRHVFRRLAHAAAAEASVLKGGTPAIVMFGVTFLVGGDAGLAASVATYFSVLILVCAGYLTAWQSGRRGSTAVTDALLAGLLGVVVVVAKSLIH
jgi:hypothetical protein